MVITKAFHRRCVAALMARPLRLFEMGPATTEAELRSRDAKQGCRLSASGDPFTSRRVSLAFPQAASRYLFPWCRAADQLFRLAGLRWCRVTVGRKRKPHSFSVTSLAWLWVHSRAAYGPSRRVWPLGLAGRGSGQTGVSDPVALCPCWGSGETEVSDPPSPSGRSKGRARRTSPTPHRPLTGVPDLIASLPGLRFFGGESEEDANGNWRAVVKGAGRRLPQSSKFIKAPRLCSHESALRPRELSMRTCSRPNPSCSVVSSLSFSYTLESDLVGRRFDGDGSGSSQSPSVVVWSATPSVPSPAPTSYAVAMASAGFEAACGEIRCAFCHPRRLVLLLASRSPIERQQIRLTSTATSLQGTLVHAGQEDKPSKRDAVVEREAVEGGTIVAGYHALVEVFTRRKQDQLFFTKHAYMSRFRRNLD
ncbi:hypothetical protein HU200_041668 [Digitaria exilis]|uniref:Uncharacterized protein n=1 Tax=Digitaria exilis TaxID=1010633 RepID=A0A835B6H1_9POAL|nr:hypothetical protein HU200_041668 [Digitaria exilis]